MAGTALRLAPTLALRHGAPMPMLGIGTYQLHDADNLHRILDEGLRIGYRLIDTAIFYRNEDVIGRSLKTLLPAHNLQRSDVFITSKLPPVYQGAQHARQAILESLRRLQVDYLDLFLIHWPGASKISPEDDRNRALRWESWQEMEKLHESGVLRAIGVSNYTATHMNELGKVARVLPAVNQCELHPYYIDQEAMRVCKQMDCHYQAYSSLGSPKSNGALLREPLVVSLAAKHQCTPANVLLAFALAQGCSALPRTSNVSRLAENWRSLDVRLSDEEVDSLTALSHRDKAAKFCWDPIVIK